MAETDTIPPGALATTLKRIRAHFPCREGWEKLLKGLGKTAADDEPLPYARILEINGLNDALWCCRAEPQYAPQWRLFAVWCARQVQHLITDQRSIAALDVAERHARGLASDQELDAARTDARAATASVAEAGWNAEWAAALAAARAATASAAWAAASAAWAVEDAAWAALGVYAWGDARCADVRDATWAAQKAEFLRVVNNVKGDYITLSEAAPSSV